MDDWEELFSESKQKPYWKNKATGEKTWKNPKGASTIAKEAAPTEAKEVTEPVSDEWEELFSEQKGKKYWKNKRTGEKTLKPPPSVIGTDAPKVEEGKSGTDPNPATEGGNVAATESDWVEMYSEAKGKPYWKNTKTGEKSWRPPTKSKSQDAAEDAKSVVSAPTSVDQSQVAPPHGWVELFSEKKGKKYWKNKLTGESTWKMPPELANAPSKPSEEAPPAGEVISKTGSFTSVVSALTNAEVAAAAASNWTEHFSEKKGKKYWKNKATGESTWKMPPELANPPQVEAKATPPAPAPAAPAPAPVAVAVESDWVEKFSESKGKKYWKNKVTGETTWKPPPPPASAPLITSAPAIAEEKTAEIVVPTIKVAEVVVDKRSVVFRSIARSPTNPTGLYLFELIGPIAKTQLLLHEITQEAPFLVNCENLLSSPAPLKLDGAIEESRRFDTSRVQKIVCNKEVGSLLLTLPKSAIPSLSAVSEIISVEESKSVSVVEETVEELLIYFHSALLCEQIYYLIHYCCYQCSPESPFLTSLELSNNTENHRLLAESKICDLFVNASYLTSIPERYIELEMIIAKYNKKFYQELLFTEQLSSSSASSSLANTIPNSIRYVPSLPIGQKDIEVTLHQTFPLAGMIVLKVHLHLPSSNSSDHLRSSIQQMKSGAWMPCWIQIDYHQKSITFFERGPTQPSTFKIYCSFIPTTLLRIHDLTDVQDELKIEIMDAVLAENNQSNNKNIDDDDNELEFINISFLFKNIQDLWRWTLSFSAICSMIQWKNSTSSHEFTQPIKLARYHHSLSLHHPAVVASGTSGLTIAQDVPVRAIVTDGNVLLGLESAIVDRDIIHQLIRYVSLPGYLIHQQFKFFNQQQRILMTSKLHNKPNPSSYSSERIKGITDGSLLLSINGLSAVQLPGNTVIKFINDIPDEMNTDMAFIKFTPIDFIVNVIEIDHKGLVHHEFFTGSETSTAPSLATNTNARLDTSPLASRGSGIGKKLDVESKNQLHRVLEKKRNFAMQQTHSDPDDTRTMEEKLLAVDLGGHSIDVTNNSQPAKKRNENLLTLQQFHLTNFEEISWARYRLSITNGKVIIASVNPTPSISGLSNGFGEIFFRFSLSQMQLKVIVHQNKDSNDLVSLQEIGLEIYDSNSHVILHCMNFKKFRALLHHLLLGMKLYGALALDLPYIYSQSEKWKMIKQQSEIGMTIQASSTTTSSVLAKQKLMLEGGDMLLSEVVEENQHKERLRKAASKYATSGILQQAVLLANLEDEAGEAGKVDSEEEEINGRPNRGGKDDSHHRRESVIMSISSVIEDYSDEHRSRSLLQAAESLEETLSSLELPLVFPTPTVIEQNLQELRAMNKANHQLMAELMTLQLDVISPIDHLNGVGIGATGGSQQQNNPNQGAPGVGNKNPYQGYGEVTQTVEDQYNGGGESTLEDNDIESIVENVNNIDDNLFSTNEPPHPPVMSGPIPPPPSGSGTPQQGHLPRRSSFITGNPIDISQQKPNAPKLTRRASRLSVSIDLSNTNAMNTSSPALLPPQQSKPAPTKTFSLSSDDQLALKILFLHLRENPTDLISTASKIVSVPDLAVYAYIVVNRVYCQFSSDSLRLCDLIDAAMKYENPILNQSSSSKAPLSTSSTVINPLAAASPALISGGSNQPAIYLDDFATAASLMTSTVSRAAGIGVSSNNNYTTTTMNFNPLGNAASASANQQQNYHYLYFNEFVQYFSYSIKPATSINSGPFHSPFKSINTQAATFNKPISSSIHSNTLLLLLLYEISQRLDIMTFIETLCQDIQLSQIHFPSNSLMTSAGGLEYPQSLPPVNSLNFTISIQEICQFIINPLIQRLEILLNENQVPSILLLMMKKLSLHYHYDVHYLEYLYAMIIQFVLHKIMIFYRSHYDENNPIQVANHLNQQIQQMNYMSYMMSQQGGGSGSVGYPNSPAYMMMNTTHSNTNGGSSNPMLFMQEEQLIYMIQYIKQVLLLCFQSASASSAIGTAASATAQSIAAGGSGASTMMGANNTIQINQKLVTLSLSDIAVLSKSKWLLSRCLERFVHTIEDLTRQNVHSYGVPSTLHNTNTVNTISGGPLASLSYLHHTTGKSKIIEGYLCLRPSELLFLLQLFDFYNLTSSSLIISSSSRQLSQAITILQSNDIIGRLSYYTLSLPTSSATSTATSNTLLGASQLPTRRTYQRLSIDREITIVLEVDPSIPFGKYETTGNGLNTSPFLAKGGGLGHGGLGHSKSWADLLFEKHGGGNLTSVHSESMDSTVHTIIPSNHANQSTHEVTSLLDDNNASFFLFPESHVNTGGGDSVQFSSNSSELQSIQWLINTARITLQYIYENISNLSLQKSKSIIKELTDIHQKLQEKKKIIQVLLTDYQRLLLNKDYLFHEKLLLQVNYDLLQYNIQIHGQTIRAQRAATNNTAGNTANLNNSSINAPKRNGSVINPMNMVMPTMTAVPGVTQTSSGGHTAGGLVSSTNYYYDIYYSPLQFILSRMLSHLIYQDYYQGKFHFYQEEEKEVMIQQFILKAIHLEKQLSAVTFAFAPSSSSSGTHASTHQNENVFAQSSGGGGLLSQRVQQQKVIFGSSSVHHTAESTNSSSSSNSSHVGILPMTGGMNPLRVIMQNVFNSSSSAQNRGNNQLPSSPSISSPQHNNQSSTTLYARRLHY